MEDLSLFGSYTLSSRILNLKQSDLKLILILSSLHLFGGTRRYHRDYGTYTVIAKHVLVLQILHLFYRYGITHRYY